jgi:hypothetical protein
VYSQNSILELINETVSKEATKDCITFLASDEMRGRGTGTLEIDLAAEYLKKEFEEAEIKPVSDSLGYFQPVKMIRSVAPSKVSLEIQNTTFDYIEDLLLSHTQGAKLSFEGELVFVGYGQDDDFDGVDLRDKIVVSYTGTSDKSTGQTYTREDLIAKQIRVRNKGAIALIEILTFENVKWSNLSAYLVSRTTDVSFDYEDNYIPHLWMRNSDDKMLKNLINEGKSTGSFTIDMPEPVSFSDNNVIGWIEGTDPKLKDEFVVLSAHYDHLGVFKDNSQDSIYNGARDNGIGVAAMLYAGKAVAKVPPKRSVLVIAFCGEEIDLLGSKWYVKRPFIPLNQMVFNLNCDGAGYNDKRLMTMIDFNRTTADGLIREAASAYDLILSGDPAPSENLYKNSDNFSFACLGVPAVDIAPGVRKFNRQLKKYYHRPNDEMETLDFDYLERFIRAYAYAAFLLANADDTPDWIPGDEFEEAGKKLYDKN